MIATVPRPGDYVVEYRNAAQWRGAGRVAVVHLTTDAGPEELFSSSAHRCGDRAESLAALWALEDGTRAWRVLRSSPDRAVAEPIGVGAGTQRRSAGD